MEIPRAGSEQSSICRYNFVYAPPCRNRRSLGDAGLSENGQINNGSARADAYRIFFLLIGVVAAVALMYSMRGVAATITISLVFFYILDPLAVRISGIRLGRLRISPMAAAIIAFVIGVLGMAVFVLIMIPPVVDQVERFVNNFPEHIKTLEGVLADLQHKYKRLELPPEVQSNINSAIEKMGAESSSLIEGAVRNVSYFFEQVMLMFMIPFITFYMLIEKSAVKQAIVHIFPRRYQAEADIVLTESNQALQGYITGQLILSLIMGVAVTVILSLMGIKAPLLLGLFAGVTKLIPVIGIVLGCIPASLTALSISLPMALWVIVIFSVIQLLENKVILPLMLSRYVGLSPLTILVTLIVGEQLGGVLGMFIATPITAVLHVLYTHLRKKYD
jgi:predicted PurR-regulated permease PerM